LQKTSIEWVKNPDGSPGYTWNPITGCLNHDNGLCKGGGFPCCAYKLANGRLKPLYLRNTNITDAWKDGVEGFAFREARNDPFYPRFWEDRLLQPEWDLPTKPCGIFVCDMGELFGDWIPNDWTKRIFKTITSSPGDRFYILTKQPQNLIKFSPFPENCWVGVTATNTEAFLNTCTLLEYPLEARVKYISLEPLLDWDYNFTQDYLVNCLHRAGIKWLIIGACTGTHRDIEALSAKYPELWGKPLSGNKWALFPKVEWVREIEIAAKQAYIPIFEKDNLRPLLQRDLIQELPAK